jgi:hypothetical protein
MRFCFGSPVRPLAAFRATFGKSAKDPAVFVATLQKTIEASSWPSTAFSVEYLPVEV